jgi:hypothetical protein
VRVQNGGRPPGREVRLLDVYNERPVRVSAKVLVPVKEHPKVINDSLKVPKRENFSLAFFALSEPIWVCDLGTGEKNRIFYQLTPDFDGFWFFAAN